MTRESTSVAAQFDRFVGALEDDDLPKAVEHAVRIEEADASPRELLAEFEAAIREGEDERAWTLLGVLDRRYEELRAAEVIRSERAVLARQQYVDDREAIETLAAHSQAVAYAKVGRAGFLPLAATFLEREADSADRREELVETTADLRERERVVEETGAAAEPLIAETATPARVVLATARADSRTLVAGDATDLVATVANVGGEPASDVEVELSAPAGIAVDGTGEHLDELAARTDVAFEFEVTGSTTGTFDVEVTVDAGAAGADRASVGFDVRAEAVSVAAAIDRNGNGWIDTPEIQEAIEHWVNDEPVPDTDGTTLTTEELRELIVLWATDQPV